MTGEPNNRQLTLAEVAELLNASTAYVVGLLERGEIRFVGSAGSPAIEIADVLSFKDRDDAERRRVLDELTAEAEKYHLGY
jgi:excisionase family DNA binding protein